MVDNAASAALADEAGAPVISGFPDSSPHRVSDEMIDAGVTVLRRSDRDYETDSQIVSSIFLAMVRAGAGRQRFERAVDAAVKGGPKHRIAKKAKKKGRKKKAAIARKT